MIKGRGIMVDHNNVYFIGYASGIAGPNPGSADGPVILKNSLYLDTFFQNKINIFWQDMVGLDKPQGLILDNVVKQNTLLAKSVSQLVSAHKFFIVFGGDHSCAIGTWSGVKHAIGNKNLGLIWIDAHMDSHTPDTSLTGNIHGMPLACLLGHGNTELINILTNNPKIKPKNVCLIGTRSYEAGEEALLKQLNVRVFYMDEVKKRGIVPVMKEALAIVKKNTTNFGITLDIDAIDPQDAPGTGVVESDGIRIEDLYHALYLLKDDPQLIGAEVTEFDPHKDKDQKTEKIIAHIISSIILGK